MSQNVLTKLKCAPKCSCKFIELNYTLLSKLISVVYFIGDFLVIYSMTMANWENCVISIQSQPQILPRHFIFIHLKVLFPYAQSLFCANVVNFLTQNDTIEKSDIFISQQRTHTFTVQNGNGQIFVRGNLLITWPKFSARRKLN